MKCLICNRDFLIDSLNEIFNPRQMCNKCLNLFIYNKKNVKIEGMFITVFFCRYLENIRCYSEHDEIENFNKYVVNTLLKNKVFYDLKTITNYGGIVNKKCINIVFKRSEFKELLNYFKQLRNNNKKVRIKAYEIVVVNTKKTQHIIE